MRLEPTEEEITEAICQFLELFAGAQLNRIAPGGFFRGGVMKKHKSRFVKKGVSDIQFVFQGMFYAFEVKTPTEYAFAMKHYHNIYSSPYEVLSAKKRHLKDQIEYLEGIRRNGFVGEFVNSVSMVKEILTTRGKRNKR